jgi:3-deoxy-manno-octulosonate cytidylyltransferase (CMP-KDO synthetase)
MSIIGIIPARYASTRFPGKPLADIVGKSMLQRVFERASEAKLIQEVLVATDDERIADHARSFGAPVVITRSEHPSGTDRCYEALMLHHKMYDYVINIQGDEPFLDPRQIDSLAQACNGTTEIATQMTKCTSHQVLFDKGEVKIVLNSKNEALFFSRNVIPLLVNVPEQEWHLKYDFQRHVGMYAYRSDILKSITNLKPSGLEKAESLEQLRWLENGFRITCVTTDFDSRGVDTPEDLDRIVKEMQARQH